MRIIRSRQETRERILQTTQILLDRTSAQEFQIRDVAREAGVSASLIIQYFNSKNELVFETALRRLEAMHQDLTTRLAQSPEASVADVVRAFFECDMPISHVLRDLMTLSWWWSPQDEQRVMEAFTPREDALRTALAHAGGDASEARVRMILSAYFAALRRALVIRETSAAALARILERIELTGA